MEDKVPYDQAQESPGREMPSSVNFTKLAGFQPQQLKAWRQLHEPGTKYQLYGGAMGGGKSYYLRWAAVGIGMLFAKKLNRTGVPIGLFSEDYPTLKDRQISKMVTEFPPWLGQLKSTQAEGLCFFIDDRWGGARVLLRNLDDPSKYMSTEFAAILVEELTKNTHETFINLRTRLRFPGINRPLFIGATNPGGVGHVWCKSHWLDKNSGDPEQELFQFVPATMDDNMYLPKEYTKQIESLPPRLMRAYKYGDWDAFEGQFFSTFDKGLQIIDPFMVDPAWPLVGSLDPGWGSHLSFGLQARDFSGIIYRIATYYVKERGPEDHARAVRAFIDQCIYTAGRMPNMIVSGHDAWARKDMHAIQASSRTMYDVFLDNGMVLNRAQVDRLNGWAMLQQQMPGKYKIFRNLNEPLVEQLTQTLGDPNHKGDIQGRGNDSNVPDHAIDEARYGNMAISQPVRVEEPEKPIYKSGQEYMARTIMDKIGFSNVSITNPQLL